MHCSSHVASAVAVGVLALPAGAAADARISFRYVEYAPAEVTVAAGSTVTWAPAVGDDFANHPLVAVAGQGEPFGKEAGDAPYSYRFEHPGTYLFYCRAHGFRTGSGASAEVRGMSGQITVTQAGATGATGATGASGADGATGASGVSGTTDAPSTAGSTAAGSHGRPAGPAGPVGPVGSGPSDLRVPPGAGALTLRVRAAGGSRRGLGASGLRISVKTSRPALVTAVLTIDGRRAAQGAPTGVRVAGERTIRLRLGPAGRRVVRHGSRRLPARLVVTAVHGGERAQVRRTLVFR